MEKKLGGDLQMEASEGGLRELVLRWFMETQETFILHNGNFPDWFQGFAARKDAEDQLRDKALGCFLVRLSDKAIGYILSYRGLDRCRHFVITQNQDGHFVLSGDCQTHQSLRELIEHHMVSPIQPFGEYLTSSCSQERTADLYDVVSYSPDQAAVSVQALRTLWDQKNSHHHRSRLQMDPAAVQPPALPPKSNSRKLTGTVSVDAVSLSQSVPPVPRRNVPLGFSLSGSLPNTTSHHTNTNRSEQLQRNTTPQLTARRDTSSLDVCPAGGAHSELTHLENRRRSQQPPPQLDDSSVEEGDEFSNRIRSSYSSSPTPMKRVTCHTYSLHDPEAQRSWTSRAQQLVQDLGILRPNPLYQPSDGPGGSSAPQGDSMYAEVPERATPTGLSDYTYEQVPREPADSVQGNMYESLDEMKTKSKSSRGKNNLTWKKFLPEYKKK